MDYGDQAKAKFNMKTINYILPNTKSKVIPEAV
jgi:hypothetical protein